MVLTPDNLTAAILEVFRKQGRPNGLHRYNLLGRDGERGQIERYLEVTFSDQQRVLAGQLLSKLERNGILVPSYKDMGSPGDWLVINDVEFEGEYNISKEKFNTKDRPKDDRRYKCFVIMPIGEEGTIERKNNMSVYSEIIEPCVKSSGFNIHCYHADLIDKSGAISKQVIEALRDDDIVIADLRRNNPNVIYELGIRHTFGKRSILICSEQTEHFFHTTQYRAIRYKLDGQSNQDFYKRVINQIEEILQHPSQPDNPVTDTLVPKSVVARNLQNNKLHLGRKFKVNHSLGELHNISDEDILDLDITLTWTDKTGKLNSCKSKVINVTDNPVLAAPFNPTLIKKGGTMDIYNFPRTDVNVTVKGKIAGSGEEFHQEFNIGAQSS